MTIIDTFNAILSGKMEEVEIASFLLDLQQRGETIDDITAAATAMRAHMTPFDTADDCIDVCGTGGDGHSTFNISTTVALVVAACGVKVAKHGNRSVSSKSGSSDVLGELGVGLSAKPKTLQRCLDNANICFLAAPLFHPAMKYVAPVRAKLKTRTIFNVLGPLCNPAGVTKQVMGVYDATLVEPIAHVLKQLGSTSAMVVHGADGLDELSVTDASAYARLSYKMVSTDLLTPEQLGLERHMMSDLVGGNAKHNAAALRNLLAGEQGAYRDAVLLNASAALIIADRADDLNVGMALAAEAIDSGRALQTLDKLIEASHD